MMKLHRGSSANTSLVTGVWCSNEESRAGVCEPGAHPAPRWLNEWRASSDGRLLRTPTPADVKQTHKHKSNGRIHTAGTQRLKHTTRAENTSKWRRSYWTHARQVRAVLWGRGDYFRSWNIGCVERLLTFEARTMCHFIRYTSCALNL